MAGRVSAASLQTEYVPSSVGAVSGTGLMVEYTPSSVGSVSGTGLMVEYMPTYVGAASAVLLMVEYTDDPATNPVFVQGEEQLQMMALQGSEFDDQPGQVSQLT